MAFTLIIKRKGFFHKRVELDMQELINRCGLEYGEADQFWALRPMKELKKTGILYNPERIGRGIYYNMSNKNELVLGYSIPTTPSEIRDFVRIVKEVERQVQNITMYCDEEKRYFTSESLEANVDNMIAFSLKTLNSYCKDAKVDVRMIPLAKHPWYFTDKQTEQYAACQTLWDFETTVHELQKEDGFYARPVITRNPKTGKLRIIYVVVAQMINYLLEDPRLQLLYVGIKEEEIEDISVGFMVMGKDGSLDNLYSYESFMKYMLANGAKFVDEKTVSIPALTEESMKVIISNISAGKNE